MAEVNSPLVKKIRITLAHSLISLASIDRNYLLRQAALPQGPSLLVIYRCLIFNQRIYRKRTCNYTNTVVVILVHTMSKSYANWRRTPEQAKAVYVYTRLDEHGLGRCAQWEIMVVSTDDKPIAMWVERVRWDGHETGEFNLDTTDDPDCIGIGGNEISPWLHRGHIVELEFGEPTDLDHFIYAMRDDASEYFRVTIGAFAKPFHI